MFLILLIFYLYYYRGITANNTSCGIRGGLNPWNDRSLVKSTKKEWEFFKTIWDNEDEKYDFERLSVFPGDNETVLNFGWYSSTKSTPVIRISSDEDMTDPVEFTGTVEKLKVYIEKYGMIDYILDGTQYYSNKVNVTGIKRNSLYYYQRKLNGKWEDPIEYKTYDPDNFSFIFMGDPQIGASRHRHTRSNNYTTVLTKEEGNQNDAFNWRRVISRAVKFARHPSLLLTAGDQVDESGDYTVSKDKAFKALKIQESQYSAYLYPDEMQKVPTANCVGNHEMLFENYRNHFNVPNPLLDFIGYGAWTSLGIPPEWTPGHSYFFKYNNALVVILETNYGSCVDFQTIIKRATKKYPNADWRIAMFHHDIYGNGATHSQKSDILRIRKCLTRLFHEYKFDLVINGHDHVYTASKFVSYVSSKNDFSDFSKYKEEYDKNIKIADQTILYEGFYAVSTIEKNVVHKNRKGTFFITANCATGSKYLGFTDKKLDYIQTSDQTFTTTFGMLDFVKEKDTVKLTITSYDAESYEVLDGPYIFQKSINQNKEVILLKTKKKRNNYYYIHYIHYIHYILYIFYFFLYIYLFFFFYNYIHK